MVERGAEESGDVCDSDRLEEKEYTLPLINESNTTMVLAGKT